MIKFLLIVFIIGYLLYRVLGFVFKLLLGVSGSSQNQRHFNQQHHKRSEYKPKSKPADGNVNIDYVPDKQKKKGRYTNNGEYIDYEEIKK